MTQKPNHLRIACLLFGSGLCALVYQTVWLREFRLIFGASTAASAAVLGIFMAGLGLGSAVLGKRAEAARKPLEYYARLEILISLSAALTPLLFWLIRNVYVATGGSMVLGQTGATVVRLLLAGLVLSVPTFLMGGTLPAAARAAESEDDHGRRRLALLYACNTFGAVAGAVISTFFLIEHLGNRQTLWLACGLNLLVAMIARVLSRSLPEVESTTEAEKVEQAQAAAAVPWKFAILAAAGVGWAFMLMELVWYRMLSPILGGSTFTFGLILAVALLGIGLGGWLYALLRSNTRPTANGFAATCAIEALCISIPFALGDRLATMAMQLRHLSAFGFEGYLFGWTVVAMVVILPAAIVAGYQFPMLIALLGSGREGVGKHTGLTYAANTTGAIVGSLGGGFGLLPALSALGAWKLVVISLVVLAAIAVVVAQRGREPWQWTSIAASAAAVALLFSMGPTAAWRHSGIGAGRGMLPAESLNTLRDFQNGHRRSVLWEADGVESSVAFSGQNGISFVVNGKVDGNSRGDAGTQVMSGMIGALIHPNPKRALVIGLGTGSSAGWLASIPSMERVDVVELEEIILHAADVCSPVNQNVLKNPKVHIHIGDARETLLAGREKYDVIFSEPSNPYRAGIASLFSKDFYEAVASRVAEGGLFIQWAQLYDVDAQAVQTVFATVGSVFPHVETWHTQGRDIVLISSQQPVSHNIAQMRERVQAEPFRSALMNAWRVDSVEGVLSHFLVDDRLARACVESGAPVSTDDRNHLEFGFARSVGRGVVRPWEMEIRTLALEKKWHRPAVIKGEVDWEKVDGHEISQRGMLRFATPERAGESKELKARREWMGAFLTNREQAAKLWKAQPFEPLGPYEVEMLTLTLVDADMPEANRYIEMMRKTHPTEADALLAVQMSRANKGLEAVAILERTFVAWRNDAWVSAGVIDAALNLASALVKVSNDPAIAERICQSLKEPFSLSFVDGRRVQVLIEASQATGPKKHQYVAEVMRTLEPHVPWHKRTLEIRARAYQEVKDPRLDQALVELREYLDNETPSFKATLSIRKGEAAPEEPANAPEPAPTENKAKPLEGATASGGALSH
jgi:spermidine synthase